MLDEGAQDSRSAGPIRFSLRSLLLLPLLVSPLFLSTVFVRGELRFHGQQSMASVFNLLPCTAIYAAIFAARSRRRTYAGGKVGPRHVLPAARVGAAFGVLFMVQVVVPLLIARAFAQSRRFDSIFDYLSIDYAEVLNMAAALGGMFGLFGIVLGALGGSIVGLIFEWHYARTSA